MARPLFPRRLDLGALAGGGGWRRFGLRLGVSQVAGGRVRAALDCDEVAILIRHTRIDHSPEPEHAALICSADDFGAAGQAHREAFKDRHLVFEDDLAVRAAHFLAARGFIPLICLLWCLQGGLHVADFMATFCTTS